MLSQQSKGALLGVLDIGSNTVHMLIVNARLGARPEAEASRKTTVRLMDYIKEDGSIRKGGVETLLEAIDSAMQLAEEYKVANLLVMATSAIHDAPNGNRVLHEIEEVVGQRVTVLSGEDEARLTFLAARRWYGWDAGKLLMLDIGGGSLEVAMGTEEEPSLAYSARVGAGVVTRDCLAGEGPASEDDVKKARKYVREKIDDLVREIDKDSLPNYAVGTSKAIRSLAKLAGSVHKQSGREDALVVTRRGIDEWIPRLAAMEPKQRAMLPGITQDRSTTIVGAAVVTVEVMEALGIDEVEVCPWALREGAILRWLDQFGRTRFGF